MVTVAQLDILLRANLSKLDKDLGLATSKFQKFGTSLSTAGANITAGISLPLAALGGASIKAALDFEQALAGVAKTVQASEDEIASLGQGFRDLSQVIPVSANELAALGQIAGQLGIQVPNILAFVETAAQLGVATNLSAREAATGLARLAKTTQTAQTDIDRLGAALVALGNTVEADESEILALAQRISGTATALKLTQGEVLGFAASLRAVGIEAQLGGTAIQRLLIRLQTAVSDGGAQLKQFARVADTEVGKFRKLFDEDASEAVSRFFEGLGRQEGAELFRTLQQLGIEETRLIQVLVNASRAAGELRAQFELGNKAFEENNALVQEASRFFGTTANQLKLVINQVVDLARSFGEGFLPAIRDAVSTTREFLDNNIRPLVDAFAGLPEPIRKTVLGIGAFLVVLGPATLLAGKFALSLNAIALASAKVGASTAFGGLVALLGSPWAAAAAAAAAAGGFVVLSMLEIRDAANEAGKALVDLNAKAIAGLENLSGEALNKTLAETETQLARAQADVEFFGQAVAKALEQGTGGRPLALLESSLDAANTRLLLAQTRLNAINDELTDRLSLDVFAESAEGAAEEVLNLRGFVTQLAEAASGFAAALSLGVPASRRLAGGVSQVRAQIEGVVRAQETLERVKAEFERIEEVTRRIRFGDQITRELSQVLQSVEQVGKQIGRDLIRATISGVESLSDLFKRIMIQLFVSAADLAIDRVFKALKSSGGGGGFDPLSLASGLLGFVPGIGGFFSQSPTGVSSAAVAVEPAAQFQRFPVEELQPFSVAAVAADPTFQRLIRQSIIVAEEDGF